jgi:hypothetical protein
MTTWFQYRDPLIGVLDYIAKVRRPDSAWTSLFAFNVPQKKCVEDAVSEDTIAIVHDDDLQLIEDAVSPSQNAIPSQPSNTHVQETLTADAIEKILGEKQMPLLVEGGGMSPVSLRKMQEG